MIYIGIDPGRKTGIAIWNTYEKQFSELLTKDFWGCIALISAYNNLACEVKVVLENQPK